jgi:two-component system OmpR family sensor kinase/two-component system sensor histidine kinase BaeS
MKPRLFSTMLLAFVLVIVLGVCGMIGFIGLAFAGFWQPGAREDVMPDRSQAYADFLADYYVAHGASWIGIDQRLNELPFPSPMGMISYTLADAQGRVVMSSDQSQSTGEMVDQRSLRRGIAVMARGSQVGTLITRPRFGRSAGPDRNPGPPAFFWPVLRGFLFAGLGLSAVLLGLAAFFAQRISRPLRGISTAAQALAAGRLDVQAPGARVRELDDLASSFNEMADALHQADRQRRQMTADIAHELRTPLSIIKGRLEGLQDGVYTATPEEIERLLGETALLERLIDDLRLLALAEAGQLRLYTELADPRDMLEDAAGAFTRQALDQDVTLRVVAPADLPPIEADPQRMAQVFSNLLANALRYTPAGGTITLSASSEFSVLSSESSESRPETQNSKLKTQNSIVFRIRDTGRGIAPDDLPYVFDRFYRADRSRTRGSGGAGLGLAIAKQIVLAHGGAIWAESGQSEGTTISIALPVAAVPAGRAAEMVES